MASIAFGEEGRTLSVGRVFGRGFDVIRANPAATLGTSFVLTALPSLLLGQAGYGMAALARDGRTGFYGMAAIGGIGFVILWLVAYGALVQATIAHSEGRKADPGEMVRTGIGRCAPLFLVYLFYWVAVWIGLMLLIVPGVMLAVMWSLATPALVAEHTGIFGAFGRSRALTKGARWKVFGILLLALAIYMVIAGALGIMSVAGSGSLAALAQAQAVRTPSLPGQIVSALVNTALVTWLTTVGASLFVEVRDWKTGPATERLADIFA